MEFKYAGSNLVFTKFRAANRNDSTFYLPFLFPNTITPRSITSLSPGVANLLQNLFIYEIKPKDGSVFFMVRLSQDKVALLSNLQFKPLCYDSSGRYSHVQVSAFQLAPHTHYRNTLKFLLEGGTEPITLRPVGNILVPIIKSDPALLARVDGVFEVFDFFNPRHTEVWTRTTDGLVQAGNFPNVHASIPSTCYMHSEIVEGLVKQVKEKELRSRYHVINFTKN